MQALIQMDIDWITAYAFPDYASAMVDGALEKLRQILGNLNLAMRLWRL